MGLHVVIPVAGVGTRLRPQTHTLPKVLVPVAGRPMLGHILEDLKSYDVEEVTLVIGYKGEMVKDYVTKAFPYKFRFIEQKTMEGLGHAIWMTKPEAKAKGPLLIVLGDTLYEADFGSIINSSENWIGVKEVEDPRRFGVVILEDGKIKGMVEKPADPPTNLAVVGIYLIQDPNLLYEGLDRVVESDQRVKGEIQLTDALQYMIDKGAALKPFEIREWWDCGKPETLLDTNRRMLGWLAANKKLNEGQTHPGSVLRPPVAVDPSATIENSVIGPNVSIGANAEIKNSIVEESIVSNEAVIDGALLKDSIIGERARVTGRPSAINIGDESDVQLG